jgi:hypothetical protein
MAQTPLNSENATPDQEHLTELYKEICQNIRVTDEISFKLLGTVPISAGIGSGALTILEKSQLLTDIYVGLTTLGLAICGALITFGLFQWELRNIQKCKWLIARAAKLEQHLFAQNISNPQFDGMASDDDLSALKLELVRLSSFKIESLKRTWGKTQAEKLIYWAAIGTWFVPFAVGLHKVVQLFGCSPK